MTQSTSPPAQTQQGVDQALASLRQGKKIVLTNGSLSVAFLSAEFADDASIASFLDGTSPRVLLSTQRAKTLELAVPDADGPSTVVELDTISIDDARQLANPLLNQFAPVETADVRIPTVPQIADTAIQLAKMAEILPALIYRYAHDGEGEPLNVEAVRAYAPDKELVLSASADLPVDADENAKAFVFRESLAEKTHLALKMGPNTADHAPLVRLHSECLTGDALGSRKCDCGEQLAAAKTQIAEAGGVLVYLRQEGRNIGLVNKIRAYSLQDRGLDTVDANLHIGFGEDERDYRVAAEMLRRLGVERVRLLSNNPDKVSALEREGIQVVERLPLALPTNPHNARYLATKRDRAGHLLD